MLRMDNTTFPNLSLLIGSWRLISKIVAMFASSVGFFVCSFYKFNIFRPKKSSE